MDEEAFNVAAKWWADQLRYDFRNKTGDYRIEMTMDIQNATTPNFSEEQIMVFQNTLARMISEGYSKFLEERVQARKEGFEPRDFIAFGVDFYPEGFLRKAAEETGINLDCKLRGKSRMWLRVEPERVYVRPGYHQPEITIYPVEE